MMGEIGVISPHPSFSTSENVYKGTHLILRDGLLIMKHCPDNTLVAGRGRQGAFVTIKLLGTRRQQIVDF